ncbi:MAG TPA: right-handed parallel beta-helix repeat-containing protein, partial [Candidatus Acidoferrales bacterium]|nr:right-handed parallel beta-helix repeat-containing protein [Candidatus Acidoferrales bacterium]
GLIEVSNSHDITFDHVEIRNDDYHAGFYQYNGYNIRLLGSYIHDNGVPGVNLDNGIYWDQTAGGGNLIANCLIEHNVANGLSLYASASPSEPTQVTVEENTVVNNGHYGIDVYGGQNVIVNNILSGNGSAYNSQQLTVATGTNHIIDSNIMWSTTVSHQGVYNQTGQVITNTIIADPLFANPSSHDYHLLIGSPAIGVGNPSYQQPVDKDGVTRGPSDLGAYEFVP